MKQFLLMTVMSALASQAALFEPFWGILLYYTLAILRPQHMWAWALPVQVRWSLFAALVVVVSVMINLSKVAKTARFNIIAALMTIYGLLMILSTVSAYDTETAQVWGIEYGKIIFIALIATLLIQNTWQFRILGAMILLVIGYIAWEVNSLYVFDGRLDIFHHGYGGLDNNGAGLMLGMGIPFAYAFGISAGWRWQRVLSWFLGVLMLHAMMMTYSRGAMVATLAGAIWILIHHRPRVQSTLIALVLCAAVSVLAGQEIRERFLSTTSYERDYSAQSRFASWAAAWDLAWERPLLGQGIRNSYQFTYSYGADVRGRTIHNQWLQIAADSGVPAACVYTLMLGMAIAQLRRSRGSCRRYLEENALSMSPGRMDPQMLEIEQVRRIAMGCEASLITFMTGGVFLSVELVELPWFLIMLGGVMPNIVQQHLGQMAPADSNTVADHPKDPLRRFPLPVRHHRVWPMGAV